MKIKLTDHKKIKDSSPLINDLFIRNETYDSNLDIFLGRLRQSGVAMLNVFASATIEDHLIFFNSVNAYNIINQAIITCQGFKSDQAGSPLTVLSLYMPDGADPAIGVAGVIYSPLNDCLIFAASSVHIPVEENEATKLEADTMTAGGSSGGETAGTDKKAARKSYIGIIENAARKIGRKKMRVNSLTELSTLEKSMKGFLAGRIFLREEKEGKLKISLRADNEKGVAHLLKMKIKL